MDETDDIPELPADQPPRRSRPRNTLVALALLLLVLGIGNVFFGGHKARQATELITRAEQKIAQPAREMIPLADPAINKDRAQQQISRLRVSQQFYQFVQQAGMWMIVLGIVASAGSLLLPLQYSKDL